MSALTYNVHLLELVRFYIINNLFGFIFPGLSGSHADASVLRSVASFDKTSGQRRKTVQPYYHVGFILI
jgi:hypothetical protein